MPQTNLSWFTHDAQKMLMQDGYRNSVTLLLNVLYPSIVVHSSKLNDETLMSVSFTSRLNKHGVAGVYKFNLAPAQFLLRQTGFWNSQAT